MVIWIIFNFDFIAVGPLMEVELVYKQETLKEASSLGFP